jgi:hypothetical protein
LGNDINFEAEVLTILMLLLSSLSDLEEAIFGIPGEAGIDAVSAIGS